MSQFDNPALRMLRHHVSQGEPIAAITENQVELPKWVYDDVVSRLETLRKGLNFGSDRDEVSRVLGRLDAFRPEPETETAGDRKGKPVERWEESPSTGMRARQIASLEDASDLDDDDEPVSDRDEWPFRL